jgi:hypothetical protein
MRRFYLQRNKDISGVSGLGHVAEGCQFDNGWCALVWLTSDNENDEVHSYYRSIDRVLKVHGHGGATQVEWVDNSDSISQASSLFPEKLQGWLKNTQDKITKIANGDLDVEALKRRFLGESEPETEKGPERTRK